MFNRIKSYLTLALLLLILSGAVIAQEEEDKKPNPVGWRYDAPTYAVHGPYWVGARDIEVENGDRLLMGTIWYPALNPDGAEYNIGYSSHSETIWESWDMGAEWAVLSGRALLDAAPDQTGAPYPLVILTHGFAVSRTIVVYLGEHLASYGFVVMAVDHPGGGFIDQLTYGLDTPELDAYLPESYTDWVLDELRLIEYASELTSGDGDFSHMIDVSRVGSIGHSSGGNVALQLAGAQFDLASLSSDFARVCDFSDDEPVNHESVVVCGFPEIEADMAEMVGVDFTAGESWGVVDEPVVQAVFAIAPGSVIPFGASGMAAVDVPTLIIAGSRDQMVPPSTMQYAYDTLSSSMKSMIWLENANHFVFTNCDWQSEIFGDFCMDSVWDRFRVYDLTNHFATALFLGVLYDDAEALSALTSDAAQFPGVSYETTIDE